MRFVKTMVHLLAEWLVLLRKNMLLGKLTEDGAVNNLSSSNRRYSAPEVFGNQPYDVKVDAWSMGAILYFLATSIHAFANNDVEDQGVKELVMNGNYNISNPNWHAVSNEGIKLNSCSFITSILTYAYVHSAKDLIASLLTVNPRQRLSAAACLEVPLLSDSILLKRLYWSTLSEIP